MEDTKVFLRFVGCALEAKIVGRILNTLERRQNRSSPPPCAETTRMGMTTILTKDHDIDCPLSVTTYMVATHTLVLEDSLKPPQQHSSNRSAQDLTSWYERFARHVRVAYV